MKPRLLLLAALTLTLAGCATSQQPVSERAWNERPYWERGQLGNLVPQQEPDRY